MTQVIRTHNWNKMVNCPAIAVSLNIFSKPSVMDFACCSSWVASFTERIESNPFLQSCTSLSDFPADGDLNQSPNQKQYMLEIVTPHVNPAVGNHFRLNPHRLKLCGVLTQD